jgi:hypothetical protein
MCVEHLQEARCRFGARAARRIGGYRKITAGVDGTTPRVVTDGTECLDCLSTHPALSKAYLDRVTKQEEEFAVHKAEVEPPMTIARQ